MVSGLICNQRNIKTSCPESSQRIGVLPQLAAYSKRESKVDLFLLFFSDELVFSVASTWYPEIKSFTRHSSWLGWLHRIVWKVWYKLDAKNVDQNFWGHWVLGVSTPVFWLSDCHHLSVPSKDKPMIASVVFTEMQGRIMSSIPDNKPLIQSCR